MEHPHVAVDLNRVQAKLGNLLLQVTGYEQIIADLQAELAQAYAEIARLKSETGEVRPFPAAVSE